LWINGSVQQAIGLQLPELLREHLVRHARETATNFTIPQCFIPEIPEDQYLPFSLYSAQRQLDRARIRPLVEYECGSGHRPLFQYSLFGENITYSCVLAKKIV
jgi:hypothetical protein